MSQETKIDSDKLYSTRDIATMSGRVGRKGVASVSALLKRHNIGQLVGCYRVVPGTEVPRALELIRGARSGNPNWTKDD